MALDGITLGLIKKELSEYLIGSKIDKIHQPSKNELVFILRTRNGGYRLYLSCDGQSPRVHLTRYNLENPKVPPMICMLLRKRLCGATLTDIKQIKNDRILFFEFDGTTEIGDKTKYYVICEIMGQRSNIILCDNDYKIIDAIKRVDEEKSSVREILPGLRYELPPLQEKCDVLIDDAQSITKNILAHPEKMLSKAILECIEKGYIIPDGNDLIVGLHIQDSDYLHDNHTTPFFQYLNWENIMKALSDIGYKGDFTYEDVNVRRFFPQELTKNTLKYRATVARYLIDIFNKYEKEKGR